MEDQSWRSQRQSFEQKQRNLGQCGRGLSWRSQRLPYYWRQENSVGAWQGQWRTRAGDLNANHKNNISLSRQNGNEGLNRNLNTFHLNMNKALKMAVWNQGPKQKSYRSETSVSDPDLDPAFQLNTNPDPDSHSISYSLLQQFIGYGSKNHFQHGCLVVTKLSCTRHFL